MSTPTDVIEGTATEVEQNGGRELVTTPAAAPATLFRTDDPVEVLERATRVADALKRVIVERGMVEKIGNREHVKVEGWQTLGGMVGVVAAHPRVRELPWPDHDRLDDRLKRIRDKGYVFGYTAELDAQTLDGRVVGGGESDCKRTETAWCMRGSSVVDDFALKSMAQTRATSRALQGPLRFIVTLAGYSGTPAEEALRESARREQQAPPKASAAPPQATERAASAKQRGLINAKAGEKGLAPADLANVICAAAGQEPREFDTDEQARQWITRQLDRLPARLVDPILAGIANHGTAS